jgi:hypothetical protein
MQEGEPLWIQDDISTRANIRNAFGGQLDSAIRFQYGVRPDVHVTVDAREPIPDNAILLQLRAGHLVQTSKQP